jgi:hypothetical protein
MGRLILLFVIVAVVFSLGLAVHILLWVAIILLALWVLALVAGPRGRGRTRRWYYR